MTTTKAPGQHQPGEAISMPFLGAPEAAQGTAPFYGIYGEYHKAVEAELKNEEIPAAYRKQVKDYFDSINPTQPSTKGKKSGG
jgi:hypothetical protein